MKKIIYGLAILLGSVVLMAQTGGILQPQQMPSIKLTNTTNQLVSGASTNLTTVNFPASSGAVTVTMPNTTDTVVGKATTDILTNKTLTAPLLGGAGAGLATLQYGNSASSRTYTFPDAGAAANIGLFSTVPASIQATPQTLYASAGYTNATTTFSNITGLSFAVAASTNYHATCYLTWSPGGATTVGPKYIWTGPASPTAVTATGILAKTVTTASYLSVAVASFATTLDDAVAVTASITQTDVVSIGVINGVNSGTVQLQAALHSASGTYTLANGSYCSVQ